VNIVVTVKQVPDPNLPPTHIEIDETGKRIVSPAGIPCVINGYDANALEEALRLREKLGGKVSVVGLGVDASRDVLKHALAMGADSAVLLAEPDWLVLDSAGTAQVLAAAIRKLGPFDLVLCGRQASDTDGGQVLHWLARALDIPSITPVSKIESTADSVLQVQRLIEDGYQQLEVTGPVLLGISSEVNEPRYPPPRGVMKAQRALIPGWKASDLELPALTPRVELRRLEIQLRTSTAEFIEGASDAERGAKLADKLKELGLI